MNDQRGTTVAEDGMIVLAHRHVFVHDADLRFTVLVHREVRHISRVVSLRICNAVFLILGIEVRTGALEIRPLALCVLMNMDRVLPGWKILYIESDLYSPNLVLRDSRSPDAPATGIRHWNADALASCVERGGCQRHRQKRRAQCNRSHAADYTAVTSRNIALLREIKAYLSYAQPRFAIRPQSSLRSVTVEIAKAAQFEDGSAPAWQTSSPPS